MVMLARAICLEKSIKNPRLLLATGRNDLDVQLGKTFANCGMEKVKATLGLKLIEHLKDKKQVITTLIHKFDKAFSAEKFIDESRDIFILVDESHRTNFGSFSARMHQMLSNSCYIGFTGTPLLKKEKITFLNLVVELILIIQSNKPLKINLFYHYFMKEGMLKSSKIRPLSICGLRDTLST